MIAFHNDDNLWKIRLREYSDGVFWQFSHDNEYDFLMSDWKNKIIKHSDVFSDDYFDSQMIMKILTNLEHCGCSEYFLRSVFKDD